MNTESAPVSSAPAWGKWHDFNARNEAPLTKWWCQRIGLVPGHRVLDLAAGTGLPALAIAATVRPGGHVIATDSAADMLAFAQHNAHAAGLDDITFEVMDAHELRFPDASFDAVTCSFGVMFFRDPAAAMQEARRVLVPGGRIAIAVWDVPEKHPFFMTTFAAVAAATGAPPFGSDGAGPFRFAAPGKLDALLRDAGFSDVTLEAVPLVFAFESTAQHWELVADMMPPVRNYIATRSPAEVAALRDAIAAAIAPFRSESGVHLPATALCACARK